MAQELPALREGDGDDLAEQPGVDTRRRRLRRHPHDRRVDPGRRLESLGRDVEHRLDVVAPLQHHAQSPVVLAAGYRRHPVDDLLLQHDVLVDDMVDRLEQMKEDRRRDVVGQIADDAKPPRACLPGRQGDEIDAQHVGLDHLEPGRAAQAGREVAVELDDDQGARAFEEGPRDRAQARSDLDDRLAGLRRHRPHDRIDDRRVGEKVLAETLSRTMRHERSCQAAYCGGSRSSM